MRSPRRAVLLAASMLACAAPPSDVELALYNGRVFTAVAEQPWANAVLVRGDRIALVGSDDSVLAAAGSRAVRVDLGGRTVIPGFNDAHDHIAPPTAGVELATPGPLPDPGFPEVADSLRAAAARVPPGTWLRVAVGERVLSDRNARRAALDRIAPEHPVALQAWSGHGLVLNSAALAAYGIADDVRAPLGGALERDASGRLSGLLEEYANYNTWEPRDGTDSSAAAAFRDRAAQVVGWGITSIQNMVTGMAPETVARVAPSLALPVRLRLMRMPLTMPDSVPLARWSVLDSLAAGGIVVSGTKWVVDGTPVERLAMMRRPYSDRPGWHGRLNFDPSVLRSLLQASLSRDEQPLLHAVGDSAIGLVMALLTELAPDSVWQRLRPRIEHGDGLAPDQYESARRLGIVIVQNPSHLALGPMAAARVGGDRLASYQPMRSLIESDIPLALGSDGPLNPFLNLMFAVTHPDNPAEALSMEQAVRAYTWGSALAEHREGEKGTLAAGLLADLAVLSQDIFRIRPEELPATVSVLTLVGGRVVHDPGGLVPATGR